MMESNARASLSTTLKSALKFALYATICLLVVGSAFVLGYTTHATQSPVSAEVASFSIFWESWNLINNHFYGDTSDEDVRTYGAIRGSLDALDDPYTLFIEPQRREREQEELRGSFGGIGAWVERSPDGRILLTPMDDRPAAQAGILAGDELVAVDDAPVTSDMPFDDVLDLIRGEIGQVVRLTVRREGQVDPLTFEVERAEIVTPSVSWELVEPGIGYVRLSLFNERTSDELKDAVRDLEDQGASKYVIDLRNNGGGLLPSAIDVASQFLKDGVVMYERKSDGQEKTYPVKGRGLVRDDPVAFLVNEGTASASEIVAGAIQDYERGVLIGTRTFGKASVQLIFDLSDGSSLHVTNARWLTPNRQEIDGVGLSPDLEIEITDADRQNERDPQLERAIAYLQEQDK
jgi:carboxyl-terminal processing protease